MKKKADEVVLFLSVPLALLVGWVSFLGIFVSGTYGRESLGYAVQGMGQDLVNLFFVVPLLILSSLLAWRGSKTWLLVWSGAMFYLAYSFAIYTFALHFNGLFLVYTAILGLSFYSLIYFASRFDQVRYISGVRVPPLNKVVAGFFFLIAAIFAFLWLAEDVPAAFSGITPASVLASGLLTNPVHVLDLAICLPGLVLTGIFLLKGLKIGLIWTPTLLTFLVAMAAAIIGMTIVMEHKKLAVDLYLVVIFVSIAVSSIVLLVLFLHFWKFSSAPETR